MKNERLREYMKNYLRSIFGLCIILLLFFTVNASGVGNDTTETSLMISKAETNSGNIKYVNAILTDSRIMVSRDNSAIKPIVAMPITPTDAPQGPGVASLVILAFALIILVSSRQRQL